MDIQIYVTATCARSAKLREDLATQPIGQAITWIPVTFDVLRSLWRDESGSYPWLVEVPTLRYKQQALVGLQVDYFLEQAKHRWDDRVLLQQLCVGLLVNDADSRLARLPPHVIQQICACLAQSLHERAADPLAALWTRLQRALDE